MGVLLLKTSCGEIASLTDEESRALKWLVDCCLPTCDNLTNWLSSVPLKLSEATCSGWSLWVPCGLILGLLKGGRSTCNYILPFIFAGTCATEPYSLQRMCPCWSQTLLQFLSGCYGHTEEVTDSDEDRMQTLSMLQPCSLPVLGNPVAFSLQRTMCSSVARFKHLNRSAADPPDFTQM